METVKYSGHDCISLENDLLRLLVTQSVGPRIISFGLKDGGNLFAELPEFVTELPQGGFFHFYGGHRLWQAPEDLKTTYLPDDEPVNIKGINKGLLVTQPLQAESMLQKSLEIVLTGETQVTLIHRLSNQGAVDVTCSPWTITQLKTGGMAILPQAQNDAGVLPNRSLALWSYTDMSRSNVRWGKELIMVSAQMDSPFKVGFPNPRGWLAYWLNGTLFVKHAEFDGQAEYYDFGSSSECYCNDQFLELETLAPIDAIVPGGTAAHVEKWNLYNDIECPQSESEAQALVAALRLE